MDINRPRDLPPGRQQIPERWDNSTGPGEYGTVVTDRYAVNIQVHGATIDMPKSALSGVDLAGLVALRNEGVKSHCGGLAIDAGREHDEGYRAIDAVQRADLIEHPVHLAHGIGDHDRDRVMLAADGVKLAHFGELAQCRLGARLQLRNHGDQHVRLDLLSLLVGTHAYREAGDDAARQESLNAAVNRGAREPQAPAQLGRRRATVFSQQGENLAVGGIYRHNDEIIQHKDEKSSS